MSTAESTVRTSATSSSTAKKFFVLDTNVFLYDPGAITRFGDNEVVIPLTVIEELDRFKKNNDETGRNARQTIRTLDKLRSKGRLFEGVQCNDSGGTVRIVQCQRTEQSTLDLNVADNRILGVAHDLHTKGAATVFISKDINARVKCDALGIPAEDFEADRINTDWLFDGYLEMDVEGSLIDELYEERQLQISRLEHLPARQGADGEEHKFEVVPNQYVVLHDSVDESHTGLARLLADTGYLIPVTGPRKPVFGIMARNLQQTMALDLLLDDEVKLVTLLGPAGTGKTLLALAAGLHKVIREERYDKLLTARPIMPLGRDIGFLPGDKDEKMAMWMQPVFDNIAYLLSTRGSHLNDAESKSPEQRLDKLMASGQVVLEPITYIRGRSIPMQFLIIDEAQNLSPHEVRTIISRVGEGSKIVLCGDIGQIDSPYLDALSNGLTHVIDRMREHRIAGHITLAKTERSELARVAADML